MKHIIFSLACIVLFIACSSKDQIPAGVIQPDKMKLIVWDLIKAEQYIADQKDTTLLKRSLTQRSTSEFQQVFYIHHIDRNTFYKSYSYYESHPYLLKNLMDSLNTFSQRKRGDLYKKRY